jgi:hypothetical protein
MAKNEIRNRAFQLSLPVPAGTLAGMPVAVGAGTKKLVGVALTDRGADTPECATVKLVGSFALEVTGKKGGEEKAINIGDEVFIDAEGKLSADSSKTLFGFALEPVVKNATTTIEVKLALVG